MSPQRAASPKTILLVDDDPTVVRTLQGILSSYGYEVLAAANLEDAMTASKSTLEIDLLIVDAVLPDISGPELAEILLFLRPHMKVLFITGLDVLTIRLAFDRPCVCLQKPFTAGFLVSKVQEVFQDMNQDREGQYANVDRAEN
jgi:two-component system, cell cycle sensor histidine kinase and response regulator CckA